MERHQHYGNLNGLRRLRLQFDWNSSGKLLVYSVIVGFLAGMAATIAYFGFQYVAYLVQVVYSSVGIVFPQAADCTPASGSLPGDSFLAVERQDVLFGFWILPHYWLLIPLIPAFGGLLCGFIVWSFAPEASGEGTDGVIRAFHFRSGMLGTRVPIVKMLAGFLTIGSGGSAGWEGPTTLLGAGVADTLSQSLRLNVKDRRVLLLAGAAGGLGAIFQIPFGGALYAVEVLYASTALEFAAIIPCVIASFVGYSVSRFFLGDLRMFELPSTIGLHHWTDMPVFLLFVPIIALFGLLFVRMVLELRNRVFRRLPIPEFLKPALGGFLLGCVALVYPQVFGGGHDWMASLLEGRLPFVLMFLLILPKMLATALTVSSGGSGGLLAPSLFLGGLVGGVLGHLSAGVFEIFGIPAWAPDPTTCILIGMGTFYAGIGKLPFAAAVIACEVAGGDYTLLVPLLLLNLIHIAIQSPSTSLYEEQVLAPIDSEAHFGTYSVDLLRVIKVRDACSVEGGPQEDLLTIPADASIPRTARLIATRPDTLFPVLDENGCLIGVLQAGDVWSVFRSRRKWGMLKARDLSQQMEIAVYPDDDLYKALRTCTLWGISELPVVNPAAPTKLLGILYHDDIIAAYNARLAVSQWT